MAYQNALEECNDYEIIAQGSGSADEKETSRKRIAADIGFDFDDLIDDVENHDLANDKEKLIAVIKHMRSNFKALKRKL